MMSNTANGLRVSLKPGKGPFKTGNDVELTGVFENVGKVPFSLTFWWNRFMRITDANGKVVLSGPGPVAPCGIKESHERKEPLGCTQPAGLEIKVGWDYDLKPGKYRIALVFENPPAHGFEPNDDAQAWTGRVESDPIEIVIGKSKK